MSFAEVLPIESAAKIRQNQARRTLAAIFLYFPVVGVATVMLGPVLPVLAARWAMSDAQLGTLFFASFLGQFCGAWFAARRLGVSLLLAAVGASLGCVMLAYAGPAAAHFALLFLGLGLGAGMAAANIVVGAVFAAPSGESAATGSQRSRWLAWLNVSWGLGAIACPLLVAASLRLHRFDALWAALGFSSIAGGQLFFLALTVAFAICAALIVRLLPRDMYRRAVLASTVSRMPAHLLWLFVATVILYVGTENALGGWLPTYADRLHYGGIGRGSSIASSVAFCFWSAELIGRAATAVLVKRVNERRLYQGALATLILAGITLVLAPRLSTTSVFILTIIAALSLAPLYPLVVSVLLARAGNDPRLGRVFASSSLGGTTLPWLTGMVSTHSQSLRIGLVVPAVGAVLMLLLSMYLPRGADAELSSATLGDK